MMVRRECRCTSSKEDARSMRVQLEVKGMRRSILKARNVRGRVACLHQPVAAAERDGVGVGIAQQQGAAEGGEDLERQLQEVSG
jgi:hypothetical protein